MKYFKTTILFLILSSLSNIFSQSDSSFFVFTGRDFNKPFVSEISSPLNNLSFGKVNTNKVSGRGVKKLTVNEVHLGIDIPLILSQKGKLSWALSIPVSSHMVWYPLEETTAPIINTDYRFGLSFTGHYKLGNPLIKNISFEIKPFAHESTHLGDEFTISGFQDDTSFYRVNVSYEYYEFSFTFNDPEVLNENTLSLRCGFMGLINPHKGYYTLSQNEIGHNTLYPSKRWGEVYFDLNYRKVSGSLTGKHWQPNISLELRNRIKYNYGGTERESRIWCVNTYAGYCYIPKKINTIKSIRHFIRYYNGLNPYGQFRNGTCFFIGYSMVVKI
jgi:hypothetical protein